MSHQGTLQFGWRPVHRASWRTKTPAKRPACERASSQQQRSCFKASPQRVSVERHVPRAGVRYKTEETFAVWVFPASCRENRREDRKAHENFSTCRLDCAGTAF